jgi:hypothetical protein
MVSQTNVLKSKDLFTENDYENIMISRQYNKLYQISQDENKRKRKDFDNKKFYNLSFSQLGTNLSVTCMDILNEFVVYTKDEDQDVNDLFIIFTKGGRLIYVGLILIILSILLYFVDISK